MIRATIGSSDAIEPCALQVGPVVVFRARCEARAYLYGAGEFELHEAVDKLQSDAVRTGLVASVGQDAVQAMMEDAFGPVRHREELERYRKPLPYVTGAPPICPAASTVDALRYVVRQNDPERLRAWLAKRIPEERAAFKRLMVPV
jgi:hypothetical protein